MILADDLRKAILLAAVQGKLVEQRKEEGSARELLTGLRTSDNIEGQRVKEKTITDFTIDDTSFDIPETWEWVKLGTVCTIARGGSPRPIKEYITSASDGINWIKIGDTDKNGKYIYSTAEKIKPSGVSKSRMVHAGDFLLTNSMSFGRPYILKIDGCIHDGWLVISQNQEVFDQDYLYWMLSSSYAYTQFCCQVSGAVVKNLNSDKVANSVFPLPPLAEQKRIVKKLERILVELDEYAVAEQELTSLQSAFPDNMRKSILQYAMQGKLVEQRLDEGTGDDLYQQIQAEKSELIKAGKIKKEKPLPEITDDEIPFDIPDSWKWVRFNELGETTGTDSFCDGPFGSNLKTIHYIDKPEVRIIQLSNIGEYGWRNDNVKYTSFKHLEEEIPRCEVFPGNLVIAKMMPAGRTIEVPDLGTRITLGSDAMKYVPHHLLNKQFLIWYMRSNAFLSQINADVHGITRVRTTLKKLKTYLVPMPPLAEQKRIVDKLEQILPHIEDIKEAQ